MARKRLIFSKTFKKLYRSKPRSMQAAIDECVRRLATDERHPGLRVHKMQGTQGIWEAYVDRGNRVTYERQGDVIKLRVNCSHDILRNP